MTDYNFITAIEKALGMVYIQRQIKNDKGLLTINIEDYDFKYPDEGYIEVYYIHNELIHVVHSVDKRELPALAFGC